MINVAAILMQQFGVQFYQASLTASDIDKLVRFEVLNYGQQNEPPVRGHKRRGSPSKVNWDLLERRIASSEKAYQRHIIRRKIEELVQYYEQCRQAHDLPWHQQAVMRAIEACRTPALGGVIEWCGHCQYRHVQYRSCRNRHCPKCQGLARAKWLRHRLHLGNGR